MIQVEVARHFNEDSFSFGLAQGLADRLRVATAGISCETHGEEGLIRLSTEGIAQTVNDITIEVSGCCDEVATRVRQVIDEVQTRR
jgi:hypothetical protein